MRPAREQGLSLTGPDGLLKHVTETVIETALSEAMLSEAVTEHLSYGRRLLM
ncbi:MAG: putative transposase, partial [Pseudonocardiales bacterium]|nr:putative transposase [Pseudonocardiales bacterium]